jgi:hypothetical protein
MTRRPAKRELYLTLLAMVTLGVVLLLPRQIETPDAPEYAPDYLTPGLKQQLNAIDEIRIRQSERTLTLRETQPGQWQIPELYSYPASRAAIRELLLFLAQSEIRETKTADPDKLARLKLDENQARHVYIKQDGETLYHLVLGSLSDMPVGTYVRMGKQVQTYLASGQLTFTTDPMEWVDNEILSLNRQRVRRVSIAFDGKKPYRFTRNTPQERMQLEPMEDGYQRANPNKPFDASSYFERMRFTDILTDEHIITEGNNQVTVETFDGLVLTFRFYPLDLSLWAQLSAEADNTRRTDRFSAKPFKEIQAEADALNTRHTGWLYRLGEYQLNRFRKSYYDLVEETD